jgi:hypothetical protein
MRQNVDCAVFFFFYLSIKIILEKALKFKNLKLSRINLGGYAVKGEVGTLHI